MRHHTTTVILAAVALLAVGCSDSPARAAYRRLANQVNPLLTAIKPTALRIAALPADSHAEIIDTCMSVDEALWSLRKIDFEEEQIRPLGVAMSAGGYAASLLDDRASLCKPEDGVSGRTKRCSHFCQAMWNGLIAEVARLHTAAAREGVEIVELGRGPLR